MAFGAVVSLTIVLLALFSPSLTEVDELGLYNPVYMFIHTGRMTYPVYRDFQAMVIHPPVHYLEIGILQGAGLGLPYAEAFTTIAFALLSVWLIVRSRLSNSAQLAFLAGLFVCATITLPDPHYSLHGMRPDMQLTLAWIAGLLALETGRLDGWNPMRLGLGAAVLTYASTLHYYGWVACVGLAIYVFGLVRDLGIGRGARRIGLLAAAACVVGLPYTFLFVVPNLNGIEAITGAVQSGGGALEPLLRQIAFYDSVRDQVLSDLSHQALLAVLLPALWLHIPLVVIGAVCLFSNRATRGIALASLPLPLFVLFFSQGKSSGYYLPEIFLYVSGVVLALALALARLNDRWLRTGRLVGQPAGTLALAGLLVISTPALGSIDVTWFPRPHPMEVARAATRQMIGPSARVAGRISAWYTSGAAAWREVEEDALWRQDRIAGLSPAEYFSLFDAVADYRHFSDATQNAQHETVASWYADRTLQLRGMYFAAREPTDASVALFAVSVSKSPTAYATDGRSTVRFDVDPNGEWRLATLICSAGTMVQLAPTDAFLDVLYLPADSGASPKEVALVLAPAPTSTIWNELSAAGCQYRDSFTGVILPIDQNGLVASLQNDTPMAFYQSATELFAAIEVSYQPLLEAGKVRLHVTASDTRMDLARLDVSINQADDGSSTGAWQVLGSTPMSGKFGETTFDWDTNVSGPGAHLVAINAVQADGSTIWWYDQPRRIYTVR